MVYDITINKIRRYSQYAPHLAGWGCVALLSIAVWLHAFALINRDRVKTIADAVKTLSNLTWVAQEHAARTFRRADQSLHFVAASYQEKGNKLDLPTMAQNGLIDTEIFDQVGIIDERGTYALSTLASTQHIDLSDRAYFKAHQATNTGALFISKTLMGRVTNKKTIQLTHRINDRNGAFGGVVIASVTPDYFARFFDELDLGMHGSTTLLGLDGAIRVRRTAGQNIFSEQLPESTMRMLLAIGDNGGTFTKKSAIDGIERIYFYRRIQPYSMAILVGLATEEVLLPHMKGRATLLSQAALATLLILALGIIFSVHQSQLLREIKARKQAAERLSTSKQRMALALDGANLGMWDLDMTKMEYVPDVRLAAMLGYSVDDIGMNWPMYRDNQTQIRAALYPHLKGYTSDFELIYQLRHKRGHWVWLLVRGKEVQRNSKGRVERMVGTAFDVTERVQAEQQLSELNGQLDLRVKEAEAANRAKSNFIANISHELRTPMNAVIGIGYLLEQNDLPGESNALVRKLGVAGNTLMGVINDVLDFSKIEANCMTIEQVEFNLEDVLADLSAIMSIEATKKQLALVITAPQKRDINRLKGDKLHLKQILLNLVGNAIKFTERGEVSLNISVATESAQQIRLRFAVHDTGIGIAKDRQETIFDSFAQEDESTTRRFGGSGLGLTISRRLVTLMQGKIGLVSEQGKGSQFWFTLNFTRAMPEDNVHDHAAPDDTLCAIEPVTVMRNRKQEQRLLGVRIMVVDDSDINRDVAQRILAGEGASVTLASDGRQAIDSLLAKPNQIDLILMDVQMPVMDGYAATRLIRANHELSAVPVVALTAGAFSAQEDAARDAGMNGFIAKPFNVNNTVAMILRLTGRPKSGELADDAAINNAASSAITKLPGIALDAGLANWKSERIYRQYLRKFTNTYAGSVHSIAQAEPLQARAIVHKLAGAAASLQLVQVALQARQTEQVLRSGEDPIAALAALQEALDTALASIASYAPPSSVANVSDEVTTPN
jgi:PAS domain S-box-containing protein